MYELEKTLKINLLLDFYSDLLTNKQKTYMELYFKDDLSLSEIAEKYSISRNAVHDQINRSIKILEKYESNLELLHKFNKRSKLYDEIREKYQDEQLHQYLDRLEELE